MTSRVRVRSMVLLTLASLLVGLMAAPIASAAPTKSGDPASQKAVFFASDGMRQDAVVAVRRPGPDADDGANSSRTAHSPPATAC